MKYILLSPGFLHSFLMVASFVDPTYFPNAELISQTLLYYLLSLTRWSHSGSNSKCILYTGDAAVYIFSLDISQELQISAHNFTWMSSGYIKFNTYNTNSWLPLQNYSYNRVLHFSKCWPHPFSCSKQKPWNHFILKVIFLLPDLASSYVGCICKYMLI